MIRRYAQVIVIALVVLAASSFFFPQPVVGASTTIQVPQDYANIQDAINAAPSIPADNNTD